MTREEAVRYCDEYLARHIADIDKEFLKKAKEALQQEPCTDAISRQEVLEELPRRTMRNYFGEVVGDVVYIDDIKTLPPVNPQEPKTGHWIDIKNKNETVIAVRCSRCMKSPKHAIKSDFCPKCGAKMVESQEGSNKE